MKRILVTTIILLLRCTAFGQNTGFLFPENEVTVTTIEEIQLSKAKLYSNAQEWIAKTFGDYKSVVQFEDPANGKIIVKGWSAINSKVVDRIWFTLTLEVKDKKYRCTIDNVLQSIGGDKIVLLPVNCKMIFARIDSLKSLVAVKKNKGEDVGELLSKINAGLGIVTVQTETKTVLDNLLESLKISIGKNDTF